MTKLVVKRVFLLVGKGRVLQLLWKWTQYSHPTAEPTEASQAPGLSAESHVLELETGTDCFLGQRGGLKELSVQPRNRQFDNLSEMN